VKPTSKASVCVAYVNYTLDPSSSSSTALAVSWVARLLDRAYGESQRHKRIKVLINPYGGAGKAAKWYTRDIEPIFAAAQCEVDVERTAYMGHAVEIAEKIDEDKFDVIASCSGDGLPHEVFNGLARKSNAAEALRKVAVVQLPCGTGNAMSWNLNGTGSCSMAALCIVKGLHTPLDLASVTQGEKRTISFLSQSVGIAAESDLGTDNVRWMGSARFTYGFLVRLLGKTVYPCEIAIKTEIADKHGCKAHYKAEIAKGRHLVDLRSEDESTADSESSEARTGGLPKLKYGTVTSPLPSPSSGWTPLTAYPTLGNFYCGNMTIMAEAAPFFPAALPADGRLDLVTIDGLIGRVKSITSLLAVEKGTFFDMDHVHYAKITAYRIVPKFGRWAEGKSTGAPKSRLGKVLKVVGISGGSSASRDGGYISIDGEKIPFEPFQVEVHRGLGTTLSRSGYVYESPGPAGWQDAGPVPERSEA
jgi:sphingosine kinase